MVVVGIILSQLPLSDVHDSSPFYLSLNLQFLQHSCRLCVVLWIVQHLRCVAQWLLGFPARHT